MRISLQGDVIAELTAAAAGVFAPRRMYDLMRVRLLNVGCPRELSASRENRLALPLVVGKNRRHFGEIQATGYYPEAIIVAGGARRASQMAHGVLLAYGWVERGIGVSGAQEGLSAGELLGRLQRELVLACCGRETPVKGQPYPNILTVHPFAGVVRYALGGQRFQRQFKLDATSGKVMLDAAGTLEACSPNLPKVDTGMRQVSTPMPLAQNQVSQRAGESSDLVTQLVRNYSNIQDAVGQYLSAIENGLYKPMRPDFAPVPLTDEGKILKLAAAGVATADFALWSETKAGQKAMSARQFSGKTRSNLAKLKIAMPDGSFPIANKKDLENAKRAVGRAKNPKAAIAHINKRAKALGEPEIGAADLEEPEHSMVDQTFGAGGPGR